MDLVCIHDRNTLETALAADADLNLYAIGDLDDFFWPRTAWFGLEERGLIRPIALVYLSSTGPVLHCLSRDVRGAAALLSQLRTVLPARFDAHLSLRLESSLAPDFRWQTRGEHLKMALPSRVAIEGADSEAVPLSAADLPATLELYRDAYPGNWFDPRMLETGRYLGMRVDDRLVAIAGVHVYSRRYHVAALGNITTHPAYRGRGYGTRVTGALCRLLTKEGLLVGLNVKKDNGPAISLYTKLGFETVGEYGEFSFEAAG